jgi:hypothetical protein
MAGESEMADRALGGARSAQGVTLTCLALLLLTLSLALTISPPILAGLGRTAVSPSLGVVGDARNAMRIHSPPPQPTAKE